MGHPEFRGGLQALLGQEADEVDDAVGVAPLVVVPAENLYALADDLGERRIDDRATRIALEVGADEQIFIVAEDAFQFTISGSFQRGVYGLGVGRLFTDKGEVNDRDVGSWDADCKTIELAGGFRNDEFE